jgi:catechol 2,3-dioxygenase-like lactoylglutathione lyase family enzyme
MAQKNPLREQVEHQIVDHEESKMSDAATLGVQGVQGVHHSAYPTWKPRETVHFYRDVLGFPLVHCITARGWGHQGRYPDFLHFFFDVGKGARIAFFYYFGVDEYHDDSPEKPYVLGRSRHLAVRVEDEAELETYRQRLEAGGYEILYRVAHETLESIYVNDPNGYPFEITVDLRPLDEQDAADAELTLDALVDLAEHGRPTLESVWERKAQLISERLDVAGR